MQQMQSGAIIRLSAGGGGTLRRLLTVGCSSRSLPTTAATTFGARPLSVDAYDGADAAAAPVGQTTRKIALDFNEVRLVGRVSKVLSLNPQWASFVLTTQRVLRRSPVEREEAAPAEAESGHVAASVYREIVSHVVSGRVNGPADSWQQHLYPGSHVEVTGQLAYRPVRGSTNDEAAEASEASEQQQHRQPMKFEPFIRLVQLSSSSGAAADSAGTPLQRPQQHRRQPRQDTEEAEGYGQAREWHRRDQRSDRRRSWNDVDDSRTANAAAPYEHN